MKRTIRMFAAILLLGIMIMIPCRGTVQASAEELPAVRQLLVLQNAVLVLREDGTVVPIPVEMEENYYNNYYNYYLLSEQNMREISEWRDIKQLAMCIHLIIGLKADGTVEAVSMDYDGSRYLEQASSWTNVKKLVNGNRYAAGIREDGTIVTAGEEPEGYDEEYGFLDNLGDWTDIVKLEIGVCAAGEYAAGLRSDGTMEYQGICDVGWSGPSDHIVDFSCSGWMLIAVREDGNVTANGEDSDGASVFLDWKDMKQVDCGDTEAIGLRKDGTILVTRKDSRAELEELTDVNRIELDMYRYFAAYRSDGSVWIEAYLDDELQEETRSWTDIKQVYVPFADSKPFILGLKNDGTVVSTGIDFESLYREAVKEY